MLSCRLTRGGAGLALPGRGVLLNPTAENQRRSEQPLLAGDRGSDMNTDSQATINLPVRTRSAGPRQHGHRHDRPEGVHLVVSYAHEFFFFFCLFAISLCRSRGIWRFPG